MRSDARANRTAIVDAARTLFSARGVDVPLSAVADAARIGIATLYRNFPTRDDLIRAVVEDLADCFRAVEDDYLTRIDKDPDQGWHDFVHALAALRPGTLIPALAEKFGDTGTPDYVEPLRTGVLAAQETLLERAKDAGLVRDDVSAKNFQLGIASITRPLSEQDEADCDTHTSWLIDVYLRGLRP
ncbi:helix-turn-helix domain-containing protein [Gordonia sp. (in: high G+C Gram-positive bacteria)]|jgi:AcrR family transcriptional regulator|uniref:TetR/AcrR family transcriptional regulator n=1 Tax=Gordonia sp. (in: high G+C Gram-positive bacteria) TaxID=84139 RepID=UPI001DF0307B|nr:helix-turn-helix domain-containing protein [Gordonia sp. (in: high G+C Gram-positive bacteria)]MCB1294381.1 TetR/AcrR family transcriptional regulator [Gordonia sp. (in: high G+C Gram-positive bacteria)]HMS73995.1 helix-turn-helix domain-containing protein [Gordonia sp. (in: high G+C Gram-positive bacteria)]HQV19607.1 helix-turn-helix domain-containing protein [Gordonia sp. (in: high G+C Gram-positive bacteria)]